jgi:hypothetical protein
MSLEDFIFLFSAASLVFLLLLSSIITVNVLTNLRVTTLLLLNIESSVEAGRARLIVIKVLRSNLIEVSNIIITSFLIPFSFLIDLRGVRVRDFLDSTGIGGLDI